jgi:hypothetical protein
MVRRMPVAGAGTAARAIAWPDTSANKLTDSVSPAGISKRPPVTVMEVESKKRAGSVKTEPVAPDSRVPPTVESQLKVQVANLDAGSSTSAVQDPSAENWRSPGIPNV